MRIRPPSSVPHQRDIVGVFTLLAGRGRTSLPGGSHMDHADCMCRLCVWDILALTGGLQHTVEDGVLHDLWTDGEMTAEALAEHEFSRKGKNCRARVPDRAPASVDWAHG